MLLTIKWNSAGHPAAPFEINQLGPDVRQSLLFHLVLEHRQHGGRAVHPGDAAHQGLQPQRHQAGAAAEIQHVQILGRLELPDDGLGHVLGQFHPPGFDVPDGRFFFKIHVI